jgi:hypothetical protein
VTKVQVYVETFEMVDGPVGLLQATAWLFGSVIDQLTAPLGCVPPETPVTVVVRVVVPPRNGLLEAARLIEGSCFAKFNVSAVLVPAL